MADMFAPLVAQLKANPKTIVFTEGNDPRILEAASKLLAEGVLKVVMVGNEAECKAAAALRPGIPAAGRRFFAAAQKQKTDVPEQFF